MSGLIEEAKVVEAEAKAEAHTAMDNLKLLLSNRIDDAILLAVGVFLIWFGHVI